jgi:membrane-associated protein
MFNLSHLIATGGLIFIAAMVFAEVGLLVGFFLPGDTLLISAGVFAASGRLPGGIVVVISVIAAAAIAGDNVGYFIGRQAGEHLFRKPDGVIFRQEYVEQAKGFFAKYGSKAMLFSHFVPIVRTFVPVLAGVGDMTHRKFFMFDAIGDCAWASIITLLGYYVGSRIPNINHYITYILLAAVILSFIPTFYHLFKDPKIRQKLRAKLTRHSD